MVRSMPGMYSSTTFEISGLFCAVTPSVVGSVGCLGSRPLVASEGTRVARLQPSDFTLMKIQLGLVPSPSTHNTNCDTSCVPWFNTMRRPVELGLRWMTGLFVGGPTEGRARCSGANMQRTRHTAARQGFQGGRRRRDGSAPYRKLERMFARRFELQPCARLLIRHHPPLSDRDRASGLLRNTKSDRKDTHIAAVHVEEPRPALVVIHLLRELERRKQISQQHSDDVQRCRVGNRVVRYTRVSRPGLSTSRPAVKPPFHPGRVPRARRCKRCTYGGSGTSALARGRGLRG
jgi:hypothetical protein